MQVYLIRQTQPDNYFETTIWVAVSEEMAKKMCSDLNREYGDVTNWSWDDLEFPEDYVLWEWDASDMEIDKEISHYYDIETMNVTE